MSFWTVTQWPAVAVWPFIKTHISSMVRSGFHSSSLGMDTDWIPQNSSGFQPMWSFFHHCRGKPEELCVSLREGWKFVKRCENSPWWSRRKVQISGPSLSVRKTKYVWKLLKVHTKQEELGPYTLNALNSSPHLEKHPGLPGLFAPCLNFPPDTDKQKTKGTNVTHLNVEMNSL